MEEANEIQEVMSRSYDTNVVDEDDLEAGEKDQDQAEICEKGLKTNFVW